MKAYRGVAAAAVLAMSVAACGGKGEAAEAGNTDSAAVLSLGAADVATAVRAGLREGVPLSGSLEPKVSITVGAPIAEQLAEVYVDEGQPVRQGQPMARFRDDVLRAAAASARADVATARMQTTVAVAESSRAESLFREGAIAQRDRDNALLALESARARLALAEAQAASADDRLATATLRAPASGVISRRHAQAGDRVDFSKPVLDLVDTRTLQLAASVEAQWLGALRVGRPVSLVVSEQGDTIRGRISRINPTADPATRQVRIYVEIPNPGGRLVGGLFVSGRAIVREVSSAVAVPRTAVRVEGERQTPVVYVVDGGTIAKRQVTVGVTDAEAGLVEITSGLSGGETVVIGPVDGLAAGTRVEVGGQGGPAPSARTTR